MDTSSLPADWIATISSSGDNSFEIGSFDPVDIGVYALDFTALIGNDYQIRSLTLLFEVIYCEYEYVYTQ